MREIRWSSKFKKDWKNMQAQEYFDREKFEDIVNKLVNDIPLDRENYDHPLHGKLEGTRECHISPDWLLIYAKDKNGLQLLLMRTGTHGKLFKK